jgi:hypothetical protein
VVGGQSLTVHALRFGFYALLQVLESGVLYAMLRHLIAARLAWAAAGVGLVMGYPDRVAHATS